MGRLLRLITLTLVLLSSFGISCATADVAVQTSHVGTINVIAFHEETKTVVSAGEDGRIKVWDAERERIIRSVQAGSAPIRALALHPTEPWLSIVSPTENGSHILQAWNMERGEQTFSRTLEARPLFLDYSPTGDFIFVAESRSSGVRYFDADTGDELPYPSVQQGIVTYATVGSSGNTIMTYLAGEGEILYWDLTEDQLIGEAETLENLEKVRVLPNKRYAAAVHEGDLVVVDIVEGSLMDRAPIGAVNHLAVADAGGEIVLLETTAEGRQLVIYEFDGDALQQTRTHRNPALEDMTALTPAGSRLYGGSRSGELYVFESTAGSNRERKLVRNVVDPIHDIGLSEGNLYVNTGSRITAISSDFFSSPETTISEVEKVESTEIDNPVDGAVSFLSLSDGTILLWGNKGDNGSDVIYRWDGTMTRGETDFEEVHTVDTGIRSIVEFENSLLLLTRGSRLFQLSRPEFEELMQYSALGIESVVGTERFGIVVGKTSTSSFDAAVLTIDPDTRETVPLNTDSFLVFDLTYDAETRNLYALGLNREDRVHTTITRFAGSASLARSKKLFDIPGEYLEGNIARAPGSIGVYTSVGNGGITRVTEEETETYAPSAHAIRDLQNLGGRLWSLNRDGSASVWDPESGELIGDLYFFKDGGWALITGDGNFYSSSEQADEFVEAVSQGETTEAFKLTVPQQ